MAEPRDYWLKITDHAWDRALERGISQGEIFTVMMKPTQTIYDKVRDNYLSYSVIKRRYIVVVHANLNRNIRVITLIPMNKEGAREIGFRV